MEDATFQLKSHNELVIHTLEQDVFQEFNLLTLQTLETGLFTKVVRAKVRDGDVGSEQKIAKIFSKRSQNNEKANSDNRLQFLHEVSILQSINHRYILGYTRAFDCPEEYVIGRAYYRLKLTSMLPDMQEDLIESYFLGLANALLYLHERHLVHRDIKPGKIFINDDGNVLLAGFGLARKVSPDVPFSPYLTGTPGYMAPELTDLNQDHIDLFKCDCYSLGVVLWNMVFWGLSKPDMSHLQLPSIKEQVPECYRSIMQNLLHRDSDKRWNVQNLVDNMTAMPRIAQAVNEAFCLFRNNM